MLSPFRSHENLFLCLQLLLLLLMLVLMPVAAKTADFCCPQYSIPANALRIEAEELSSDQPTLHLRKLMGNSSSSSWTLDERDMQGEQIDQQKLPTVLLRLDALLRSAEEQKRRMETTSARLLSINRGGYFRGLLIVWVPVSFLLPTLARHPTYYRSGRAGKGSRSSSPPSEAKHETAMANEITYDPNAADYQFDRHYGPLLSRLEGYFSLLRLEEPSCRQKLLCHAGRNPERFQPLSSLFRRLFERSQSLQRPEKYHPALKKFFTYVWADKKGRRYSSAEQCDQEYGLSSCPFRVDQLIRIDMLLFWQKLSERFAIQLQDE